MRGVPGARWPVSGAHSNNPVVRGCGLDAQAVCVLRATRVLLVLADAENELQALVLVLDELGVSLEGCVLAPEARELLVRLTKLRRHRLRALLRQRRDFLAQGGRVLRARQAPPQRLDLPRPFVPLLPKHTHLCLQPRLGESLRFIRSFQLVHSLARRTRSDLGRGQSATERGPLVRRAHRLCLDRQRRRPRRVGRDAASRPMKRRERRPHADPTRSV